jgi:gentisate 1,2-dioxygenase
MSAKQQVQPVEKQSFEDITDFRRVMAELEIPEPRRKALPHIWKWNTLRERLLSSEIFDLEKVHRRAFALCNPGLGGRPMVSTTLFASVSLYFPGDRAPVHRHSASASRFALEGIGGFTTVAGEKLVMQRGDLVLTPNGEWHDHGNEGAEPVFWIDILDVPLVEHMNAIMTEWGYKAPSDGSNSNEEVPLKAQRITRPEDYSQKLFGVGGIVPAFGGEKRFGRNFTPKFMYRAGEARHAQEQLRDQEGSAYEGVIVEYTNPMTGASVLPTLSFRSQLVKPGQRLLPFRTTASTVYAVLEGSGLTKVGDQEFQWEKNDIFVVPGWNWCEFENTSTTEDAILYSVSDKPAQQKLGLLRTQGKLSNGEIIELVRWPAFDA